MLQQNVRLQLWGWRISAGAFVVCTLARLFSSPDIAIAQLVAAAMTGLAAGALVIGPAWILLGIANFVYAYCNRINATARKQVEAVTQHRKRQAQEREAEDRRRQYELTAPQRELAAHLAEEQRRVAEQVRLTEAMRREDARIACELLYTLREPEIHGRFPRERYREFVTKYLGDDKPVELVERRAAELQLLIQQHHAAVDPPEQLLTLSDLSHWYEEQKAMIENLSIATIYKQDFLVQLNERYSDLTARLMQSLAP